MSVFDSFHPDPSSPIKTLRDVQRKALAKYDALKQTKRVGIELATGSGKSIIGLVILETWRKQRRRTAIVTSSTALCYELKQIADYLNIPASVILGQRTQEQGEHIRNTRAYSRCQVVGIFNYWSYMLTKDFKSAEYLVIDDADFFDSFLSSHYQVVIDSDENEKAFTELKDRVSKIPLYKSRLDQLLLSRRGDDYFLVYFTHSIELADALVELSKSGAVTGDAQYALRRNYDAIKSYLCFVGTEEIVFAPLIPPSELLDRIAEPAQVVLMSATLGSEEIIKRATGLQGDFPRITADPNESVTTMGSRLVFPMDGLSTTNETSPMQLNALAEIANQFKKQVILCTSKRQMRIYSDFLSSVGQEVITYMGEKEVENFKKRDSGILITGGRYIGIDLPGDACRVEVIPKLPYVLGPIDLLTRDILGDSDILNERTAHRIIQALGRCNRSEEDYAIYYSLDARLAEDLRSLGDLSQFFPPQMLAEMDEGQVICETYGLTGALEQGRKFLEGEWKSVGRVTQIKAKDSAIPKAFRFKRNVDDEIGYVQRASQQDFVGAMELAKSIAGGAPIETAEGKRYKSWWLYLAAWQAYMSGKFHSSEASVQQTRALLNQVFQIADNSFFNGVRLILNEMDKKESPKVLLDDYANRIFKEKVIRTVQDYWRNNVSEHSKIDVPISRIKDRMRSGLHDLAKQELKQFLELVGFEVWDVGNVKGEPDLLAYANESKLLLLIEIKTSKEAGKLGVEGIDQIGGHRHGYEVRNPEYEVIPVVFTQSSAASEEALEKAKGQVKIVTVERFLPLISRYFEIFSKIQAARDATERGAVMSLIPLLAVWAEVLQLSLPPLLESESLLTIVK